MNEPEWIVVGAGSAGCMIASQLARAIGQGRSGVTLVEPAGEPAPRINRERPARWIHLLRSGDDWNLATEKSERLANRTLRWPRGRGLGGSSRINAMIWFPPTQMDLEMLVAASGGQLTLPELQTSFREVTKLTCPEHPAWLSEASHRFLEATAQWNDSSPMVYARLNRQGPTLESCGPPHRGTPEWFHSNTTGNGRSDDLERRPDHWRGNTGQTWCELNPRQERSDSLRRFHCNTCHSVAQRNWPLGTNSNDLVSSCAAIPTWWVTIFEII